MINKRCFEADLGISRVVGHRRFEMRCTIAKYERIQCKRSDIRCHMLWGSPMIDWFDEWSYTKSSNSSFFFSHISNTHTPRSICHTIHWIIVSSVSTAISNAKSFNCQFIIICHDSHFAGHTFSPELHNSRVWFSSAWKSSIELFSSHLTAGGSEENLIWMIEDTRQLICVSHFVLKTHTNRSVSGARAHIRLRHVLLEYSSRSVSWYWSDKTTEWVYNALKIRCNVHMSNGGPLLPERKTRSAFSTWYRNPRTTHTRFCEMWMAQMK